MIIRKYILEGLSFMSLKFEKEGMHNAGSSELAASISRLVCKSARWRRCGSVCSLSSWSWRHCVRMKLLAAAGHRTGDAPAPALPPFMPWTSHYSYSMAADQLSGPAVGDNFWKNVRHCSKFLWIWRNARVQLWIWYVKFLWHFSESCLWRYRIKTKYTPYLGRLI